MQALVGKLIQRLGVRPLLLFILLTTTFTIVNNGLEQALPEVDNMALSITTTSAILITWLLAFAPLPSWLAGLIAGILGLELVVIRIGQFQSNLYALLRAAIELVGQAIRHLYQPLAAEPDPESLRQIASGLATNLGFLLQQLLEWLGSLLSDDPGTNPLALTLALNLLLWALAAWAVLACRRHNKTVLGLAPAGILLASVLSLHRTNPAVLLGLLATSLPLMASSKFNLLISRWQKDQVDHPEDVSLDATLAVIGLTIGIVALATITPSFSVRQAVRFVNDLFHKPEPVASSAAEGMEGINMPEPRIPSYNLQRPGEMPSSHLIGSGPELSEQVVMVIQTDPKPPDLSVNLYWRSRNYQTYTGRGWDAGLAVMSLFDEDETATVIPDIPHQRLWQEIRAQNGANRVLMVAGQLLSADQDFGVAYRIPPFPNPPTRIDRGDLANSKIEASIYRAESWLPEVSEEQLRAAGQAYPGWMRERYLALPDTISNRVISLTQELISEASTPYDQAKALESYLRTFTYTLDLPPPPEDRELVDYFLFELEQGYCDYYATAMAVMARIAGLPSRLVTGYTSGVYDESNDRTIVTAADSHSWVEIYFPDYGWIEFEPTGGRPEIERPNELPLPDISEILAAERQQWIRELWAAVRGYWWIALLLPALLWTSWTLYRNQRRRLLPPDAAGAALFQQLELYGQRLSLATHSGDTPYEFASLFLQRLSELAQGSRWQRVMQPAHQEVNLLTRLYVRASYSPRKLGPAEKSRAFKSWRRLRWRLWLLWLKQRLPFGRG